MAKQDSYGKFKSVLKILSNVISWTAFAILIIIAAMLIFYVVSLKLYQARGEVYEPPFSLYTIISPSMEPTIKIYDVIVNKKVDSIDNFAKGDVITFVSTSSLSLGKTVTHRIEEVVETEEGTKFKTKGDNNLAADTTLVAENDILGKVLFKIPQLGRIQFLLASRGGWLLIIVLPALAIIIYDILKIFKLVGVKKEVEKLGEEDIDPEKLEQERARKESLKEKLTVQPVEQTIEEKEVIVVPQPVVEVQPKPAEDNAFELPKEIEPDEEIISSKLTEDAVNTKETITEEKNDSFELPKLKD